MTETNSGKTGFLCFSVRHSHEKKFNEEDVFATKYETHSTDPLPHSREVLSSNLGEEIGYAN